MESAPTQLKHIFMALGSYIGVDVGGTKMQLAYVSDGIISKQHRIETGASRSKDQIVDELLAGIRKLIDDRVIGIGVGVPGLVDSANGIVQNVLNIPAWKNVPLRMLLENSLKLPVFIGNDANCFALGEKFFGIAKPYRDVVCLTLGTGVGAGVIVGNTLHVGNCAMAGEFGGIRYLDSDFENYCSGKFFRYKFNDEASVFAALANAHDAKALDAFYQFGRHVGHLVETIVYSYGPEAIILGGSLSRSFRLFEKGMNEVLARFPHQNVIPATVIEPSANPMIAVLGAAALVPYHEVKHYSNPNFS
ncbi:MAG: ROK family protein [Breznakibacter sp.]